MKTGVTLLLCFTEPLLEVSLRQQRTSSLCSVAAWHLVVEVAPHWFPQSPAGGHSAVSATARAPGNNHVIPPLLLRVYLWGQSRSQCCGGMRSVWHLCAHG